MMAIHALPNTPRFIDVQEVRHALRLTLEPEQVFEVRVLKGTFDNPNYKRTMAGYFRNTDESIIILLKELQRLKAFMGVYFTPQVCHPDLLSRIYQGLQPVEEEFSTSDKEILRYRWLLIDCDPERLAHISSTDEEHEAALQRSYEVRDYLRSLGFPDPIEADSGNGRHLMYLIDLPNTP